MRRTSAQRVRTLGVSFRAFGRKARNISQNTSHILKMLDASRQMSRVIRAKSGTPSGMAWGFDAMLPESVAGAGTSRPGCLGWHKSGYEVFVMQATCLLQQTHQHPMALITTNTSRLSVVDKCSRGTVVINSSTNNPLVPGNAEQLADFVQRQEALVAKNAEVEVARAILATLLSERDVAEEEWDRGIAFLAGVTEALTNGDRTAMLSAGFGVRGPQRASAAASSPQGCECPHQWHSWNY